MVILNLQLFGKSVEELAKEVIQGKHGNGQARKNSLGNRYSEVQAVVNSMLKGNGTTNTTTTSNNNNKSNANTNTNNTPTSNNSNAPALKINGADQSYTDKAYNSSFNQSDDAAKLENKRNDAYSNLEALTSVKDIIDQSTWGALNTPFTESQAYRDAMALTNSQLSALQSGRTSFTDLYNDAISKYLNREDFEYDVDNDQLFQQALASAMNSGKTAMQDTIGQASALTGGYGSTYATTAGNQAYNSFIEDAYNNLPEYYQMALEAYQAEGQEMFNQVAMLGEADANEYQKMYNSWAASFDTAQQLWNQDFSTWEAGINQAYNSANLQLSEHSQLVSDAYNLYNAASNQYEMKYAKEYQSWSDMVSQAQQYVSAANTDYWSSKNFDEGVRQFNYSIGDTNNDGVVSDTEKRAMTSSSKVISTPSGEANVDNIPKSVSTKVSNLQNDGERAEYLDSQVAAGVISKPEADYLYSVYKDVEQAPLTERNWTMTDDGGWNGVFGLGGTKNIDDNGKVKDQYGNEYSMRDLYNELKKTMSNSDAKKYITDLQLKVGITKK